MKWPYYGKDFYGFKKDRILIENKLKRLKILQVASYILIFIGLILFALGL